VFAELAALYRCYFFEAMRRDAFEEAYDVAKILPERKELFAELAQWATFRGEADLAILATQEAGLDVKMFAVDDKFDPQGQFDQLNAIEEKYLNEHALSREARFFLLFDDTFSLISVAFRDVLADFGVSFELYMVNIYGCRRWSCTVSGWRAMRGTTRRWVCTTFTRRICQTRGCWRGSRR